MKVEGLNGHIRHRRKNGNKADADRRYAYLEWAGGKSWMDLRVVLQLLGMDCTGPAVRSFALCHRIRSVQIVRHGNDG